MTQITQNISQDIINLYLISDNDAKNISQNIDRMVDIEYLSNTDEIPMSIINAFKEYGVDTLDLLSLYLQSGFPLEPIISISDSNQSTPGVDANISSYISSVFDEESDSFYIDKIYEDDPLFIINDDEHIRMSTVLKLVSNMFNFSEIASEALCRENYGVGMHSESFSSYKNNVLEKMLEQVPGNHNRAVIRIDGYDYGGNHINTGCEISFNSEEDVIIWEKSLVRLIVENPGILHIVGVVLRVFNDDEEIEVYSISEKSLITVPRKYIASWIGYNGGYNGVSENELGDSASVDSITEELKIPEEGVVYLTTDDIVIFDENNDL